MLLVDDLTSDDCNCRLFWSSGTFYFEVMKPVASVEHQTEQCMLFFFFKTQSTFKWQSCSLAQIHPCLSLSWLCRAVFPTRFVWLSCRITLTKVFLCVCYATVLSSTLKLCVYVAPKFMLWSLSSSVLICEIPVLWNIYFSVNFLQYIERTDVLHTTN